MIQHAETTLRVASYTWGRSEETRERERVERRRRRCSSQGREEEEEESVINISHFCANKAKDNPMPCVILDIIAFLLIGFIRIVDGKHSVYRRKKKQI